MCSMLLAKYNRTLADYDLSYHVHFSNEQYIFKPTLKPVGTLDWIS